MTEVTPLSGSDLAAAIGTVSHDGRPVPVLGQMPDRFSPPALIVTPGSPWMDNASDMPHGVYRVTYIVRVLPGAGTNTKQFDRLTALVTTVIGRLTGSQTWTPDSVGEPFEAQLREKVTGLAVDITVTALATITTEEV